MNGVSLGQGEAWELVGTQGNSALSPQYSVQARASRPEIQASSC